MAGSTDFAAGAQAEGGQGMTHISELKQDPVNINQHSERGTALTRRSIEKFGARLAGIVDRNGYLVDGNDRQIAFGEIGMEEVEVIEASPHKPVYLKFNDLDLADPNNPARELQVALHRSAVESWTVDADALLAHMGEGLNVGDWWRQDELDALLAELQPPDVEFKQYGEEVADEVKYHECPECGHKWPA